MSSLRNRLLFKKGDPLRDLHVPKSERVDIDLPAEEATDAEIEEMDFDAVRADDRVIPPEDLT